MGKQYVKKSTGLEVCCVGQLQVLTSEKPMTKVPVTSTALEQFGHLLISTSLSKNHNTAMSCLVPYHDCFLYDDLPALSDDHSAF